MENKGKVYGTSPSLTPHRDIEAEMVNGLGVKDVYMNESVCVGGR